MPLAPRGHAGPDGVNRIRHAKHIHFEHGAESERIQIGDLRQRADPGTRHEDIDGPDLAFEGRDRGLERLGIRHVYRERGHSDALTDFIETFGIAIDQPQAIAAPGQSQRGRATDPVGGPREDHDPVSDPAHGATSAGARESRKDFTVATNPSGFSSGARCFAPAMREALQFGSCSVR